MTVTFNMKVAVSKWLGKNGSVTDAPQQPPSLTERRRLELAQSVMRIAIEAFTGLGYDQVSVADICARAGISQSTFFRTFDGKPSIVSGSIEAIHRLIAARMSECDGDQPLLECYLEAFRAQFIALGLSAPAILAANTAVVTRPEVRGLFLDSIAHGDAHPFALEIARRLRTGPSDVRVPTLRAMIWVATDLAMTSLPADGDIHTLVDAIRDRLSLVCT